LVSQFQADFGGTEIYEPLETILKNISSRTKHDFASHIYLLTDGAVSDTGEVIDLIKHHRNLTPSITVHTFGIGSGASESLVKGCAFLGGGNFTFIYKKEEPSVRF
jgi:hypothetical protein